MSRVLLFLLLGVFFTVLMGSIQQALNMDMVIMDIPLLAVIYLADPSHGLRLSSSGASFNYGNGRNEWSGGVVGVLLGYFTDVMSGGIKGLHSFTLAVMFLFCRRAVRQIYLSGPLSTVLVTFVASVIATIIGLGVRWLSGVAPTQGSLMILVAQALLNAAVAPIFYKIFRICEKRVEREPKERGTL